MVIPIIGSARNSLAIIKNNDEAIARWVSHVISPHVVGIFIVIAMSYRYSANPGETMLWLTGLLPLIVVPPFGYVLWLVHTGSLEDIYMPRRESRLRPLAVMLGWLLVCGGLMRFWSVPPIVEAILLITILLVGVLSVVTLFWKISFHGASISAAATAIMMMSGAWTWPVMLLVPLVGWSRIRLLRHTPRQVFYGSLVGMVIALVVIPSLLAKLM